jgi:hypothetical protein
VFARTEKWNRPRREGEHDIYSEARSIRERRPTIRAYPSEKHPKLMYMWQGPTREANGSGERALGWFRRPTGSVKPPLAPFVPIFGAKISCTQAKAVEVELAPRDPRNRLYTPR